MAHQRRSGHVIERRKPDTETNKAIPLATAGLVILGVLAVASFFALRSPVPDRIESAIPSARPPLPPPAPRPWPMFRKPSSSGGGGGPSAGTSIPATPDPSDECRQQLRAIRELLNQYRSAYGSAPADLRALGLASRDCTCPISGEKYIYTSVTGQVTCPHGNHVSF